MARKKMSKLIVEMGEMQKLAGVEIAESTSKGEIERVTEAMFKAPKAKAFFDKLSEKEPGVKNEVFLAVENIISRVLVGRGFKVGGSADAKKAVRQLARN